jgi:mannobiose 2-epimerase
MNLYFTSAWQPIPDHDSFGHDVETAYLEHFS